MLTLIRDSANELYADVCREVRRNGRLVNPRALPTTEILGAYLCLTDPRRRLVDLPPARVLNPAFAVAEALWILSGSDDAWIYTYNQALRPYTDGGRLQGAYGPRMRRWQGHLDQLAHVRQLLTRDPDTRQAVIQLYDPQRDTLGHRDVPCTLNYRFFLRSGRLDMHTTMRSNDVWLGLPYDIFTATLLQEILAGWLGVELGVYRHYVDSLHLYAQHDDVAGQLTLQAVEPSPPMPPLRAPSEQLTDFLTAVVAGTPPAGADPLWTTFARMLASYRAWADGNRTGGLAVAASIQDDFGRALHRWYDRLSATADSSPVGSAR